MSVLFFLPTWNNSESCVKSQATLWQSEGIRAGCGNIVSTHLGAPTVSYNKQNYFICLNRPHYSSVVLLTLKGRPRLSGFILAPCHYHTGLIGWLHFNWALIARTAQSKASFQWFNLQCDCIKQLSISLIADMSTRCINVFYSWGPKGWLHKCIS